jgi:hypothetical protein
MDLELARFTVISLLAGKEATTSSALGKQARRHAGTQARRYAALISQDVANLRGAHTPVAAPVESLWNRCAKMPRMALWHE